MRTVTCVQTVDVRDDSAPVIDRAAVDRVVECDGVGNVGDLKSWLDGAGGAMTTFEPRMSEDEREARYADWKRAVERSRDWERDR